MLRSSSRVNRTRIPRRAFDRGLHAACHGQRQVFFDRSSFTSRADIVAAVSRVDRDGPNADAGCPNTGSSGDAGGSDGRVPDQARADSTFRPARRGRRPSRRVAFPLACVDERNDA